MSQSFSLSIHFLVTADLLSRSILTHALSVHPNCCVSCVVALFLCGLLWFPACYLPTCYLYLPVNSFYDLSKEIILQSLWSTFGSFACCHLPVSLWPHGPAGWKAGPWCGVTKSSEAARWHGGTEKAESCCLALQEHHNHRSMCVNVCVSGVHWKIICSSIPWKLFMFT